MKQSLSVRNNNPGNLRFVGQRGASKGEGGYAKFDTPEEGLAALRRQLVLDTQKRGLTLEKFINKYAPNTENDTEKYLNFLSKELSIDRKSVVAEDKLDDLARAITKMEGGKKAFSYFYEAPAKKEVADKPIPPDATVSQVAAPSPILSIPLEGRYLGSPTTPVEPPVMAQATPISPRDFAQSDDPFARSMGFAPVNYELYQPVASEMSVPDWWANPLFKSTV